MNGYELSRNLFDWSFENPEKISPNHVAIYFFAIEHCNRLGWKDKFGFPTQMTMDAIGIKKHQTYIRYFNDLVDWGFLKLIQKSKNQYSANIISLISAKPKNGKALDKANIKHATKQSAGIRQSTGQSNSSIDKQLNHEQLNHEQLNKVGIEVYDSEKKILKNDLFFLNLFNEQKKALRGENFRPSRTLSDTTRKNYHRLIDDGYTENDFIYAIQAMLCADWPKQTGNDTPEHLLVNKNFLKYYNVTNLNQLKNGKRKLTSEEAARIYLAD